MGMTITEKILAKAANVKKVVPGQLIDAQLDVVLFIDVTGPAAIIHTDGWSGYSGLKTRGYRHQIVRASASVAEELLPLAHWVSSLLKRWLMGTHQGAVSHEHLDYWMSSRLDSIAGHRDTGASYFIVLCSGRPTSIRFLTAPWSGMHGDENQNTTTYRAYLSE